MRRSDPGPYLLQLDRQLQFLSLLHGYCRRGCQFVIATHSPIILAYPDARIYLLDAEGIRPVAYAETEHYLVTRGFLANPERALRVLLADEEDTDPAAGADRPGD
jgi:predicted ATPase